MTEITLNPTDVVIPGRIVTSSNSGQVADASLIYDSSLNKFQEEINNEKVYRVEIYSTDGIVMNDKNQTCTLYAQVFVGNDNITNELKNTAFEWKRTSSNNNEDVIWNDEHRYVKQITVTYDEINLRSMFECVVTIN